MENHQTIQVRCGIGCTCDIAELATTTRPTGDIGDNSISVWRSLFETAVDQQVRGNRVHRDRNGCDIRIQKTIIGMIGE